MFGDDDAGMNQQQQQYYSAAATTAAAAGRPPAPAISPYALSSTAEAELYMLATNFLLYVAMVIITAIVAKIYFPEAMVRREYNDAATDGITSPTRRYSYRRSVVGNRGRGSSKTATATASGGYKDDPTAGTAAAAAAAAASDAADVAGQDDSEGSEYYGSDMDDVDLEYDDDGDGDILDSGTESGVESGDATSEEELDIFKDQPPTLTTTRASKTSRLLFDFEQTSLSKMEVMKRLIFCSLMLNVVFVSWGLLQVRFVLIVS